MRALPDAFDDAIALAEDHAGLDVRDPVRNENLRIFPILATLDKDKLAGHAAPDASRQAAQVTGFAARRAPSVACWEAG
jgi:hypothetical protein